MPKQPTSDKPRAVYMREWRARNLDKAKAIERASVERQKAADPERFRERARARYQRWLEKPENAAKNRQRNRDGYRVWRRTRRGLSIADRHAYWLYQGGLCDMCHQPYPDPATPGSWKHAVVDHDHDHCKYRVGCIGCVRGQGHRPCNVIEGLLKRALAIGIITAIDGPLKEYLADPPMQRWLREREASEDSPLAA